MKRADHLEKVAMPANHIGSCGKIRYECRTEAQGAIARLQRHGRDKNRGKIVTYRCQHCDGWHWGHEWKRKIRRDRG